MLSGCRRSRPPSTGGPRARERHRHPPATRRPIVVHPDATDAGSARPRTSLRHPPPGASLRSRAALSTYATAVQGLARLLYGVLVGHLGSRELLGQTNTSLSLSVLASQLWGAPASAAGTRFVAARATPGRRRRPPRSSPGTSRPAAPGSPWCCPPGRPDRLAPARVQPGAHDRNGRAGGHLHDVQHAARHPVRRTALPPGGRLGHHRRWRRPGRGHRGAHPRPHRARPAPPRARLRAVRRRLLAGPGRGPGRPGAAPPDRPLRAASAR